MRTHKKHTPLTSDTNYSRCECGQVMSLDRCGHWRKNDSPRARLLAGPVWEYAAIMRQMLEA